MITSGNTILITGGTAGIGQAFAEQFFAEGNTVIICGRRSDRLTQLREKLPGLITRQCDIADDSQREYLYQWVVSNYPSLNVLVNNAGMQLATDLTHPVDLASVRLEMETNFVAPLHLASLFASHLSTVVNPAIINITSGLAFVPLAFMPVYCASKAALHSLSLSMRYQLRDTPVKVYEIAPPSTDTELGHQRRADKSQTHGGIPVSEFLAEAMKGLKNDVLEIAVGNSNGMRAKREELFARINGHAQ